MTAPRIDAARDRAEEEAADRLSFLLSGEASNADRAEIEHWRALDPANDAAWARMSEIWSASSLAASSPAIRAMRLAALNRERKPQETSRWQNWRPLALVASLLLVVGSALWLGGAFPWHPGGQVVGAAGQAQETKTGIGEIRSLRLADGSDVTVNTDSVLQSVISAGQRRVRLARGEAFFKVAHDSGRPFVVGAGNISVTALGTAFSVRNSGDTIIVTLVEGRVRILSDDGQNSTILTPGMQLRADATGFHATRVEAARLTSWTSGLIDFDHIPLAAAVNEMNRYSKQRIVIADDRLLHRSISGLFPAGEQGRFVEMLAATNEIRVDHRSGTEIRLTAP